MDKNMELPEGWNLLKLGQICTPPQYGYTTSGSKHGTLKLLRTTDITGGQIDWENVPYCLENPKDLEKYLLHEGDIVISRAGSVGVSYLINKTEPSVFASYLIRFKPINSIVLSKYFYLFLKSPFYWKEITEKSLGIAVANVNATKLKEILIPIPPIKTQIQIVDKIEELFSELDKGIENLKTAQEQLKVYRQAVLKMAFEGKLTNENVKDGELPDGWEWKRISEVAKVGTGSTPLKSNSRFYNNGNIPWVTSGALNDNFVTEATEYITDEALKSTNCTIYPKHTLLLAMYGEGKTRGKCSELLIEACTNQAIAAIYFDGFDIRIKPYLKYFLQKNYNDIRRKSSGGVQPNINLGIVKNLIFPLAPLHEQQIIIREIESRLSVCDKIEETITNSLQQAEALRQSILKKAFDGKLVTVVKRQPEEAKVISIDSNDSWQRKVLAGHIIYAFQKGGYIGRTKLQKILYLCEQHAQLDFDTQYVKEAAGPLDSKFLYAFLNEGKQKNWIDETPIGNGFKYEPSTAISELTIDYPKYFRSSSSKINFIIKLLKDTDTDTAELIATIYAIWNNYIIKKQKLDETLLAQEVYDWDDNKAKFNKSLIASTWQWMKEVKLIPVGFGKLIDKRA